MQERFEKALDTLGEDKVIHGWQYENREGPGTSQCASLRLWLDSMVVIEPPDAVKNTYQSIACPVNISQKARSASDGLGELARQRRLERGIPQLIAAQEIGINHNFLCMIEKGRRKPSRSARGKIEKWLAKN
jgi:DNA-binding XRE family transcriptional regulator